MPYQYTVYTQDLVTLKGTINVDSENSAEESLEKAGYHVISLKPVRKSFNREQLFPSLFKVKTHEVIVFTQQLATLIDSGIALSNALRLLEEQITNKAFQRVITQVIDELQGGSYFTQALAKFPQVFPDIYCQLIGAGEQAGNLTGSLRQAVTYLERGNVAMKKVKKAMVYPTIVLVLAIGVVLLLVNVALPPLLSLFESLEAEVPWTTRMLIAMTDILMKYQIFLLLGIIIVVGSSVMFLRRPSGKLFKDKMFLKMPLIGKIVLMGNMSLFCRTSSVLLGAGLPLPRIMGIMKSITTNRVVGQALEEIDVGLSQGNGLSIPMRQNPVFPRLLVQMVMVGEQTGTLDSNLETLANFYEEEVNQKISALIAMIEPAMTVGIGVIVGFIALALIMPMYSLM